MKHDMVCLLRPRKGLKSLNLKSGIARTYSWGGFWGGGGGKHSPFASTPPAWIQAFVG